MTLALCWLTKQFIVIVADRRLTNSSTGRPTTDHAVKIVQYGTHASFAFSGVGAIDNLRTDRWLAKTLASFGSGMSSVSFPDAAGTLAERATQWFKSQRLTNYWHAFLGAGQLPDGEAGLVIISNAVVPPSPLRTGGLDYRFRASGTRPNFVVHAFRARKGPILFPVGQYNKSIEAIFQVHYRFARQRRTCEKIREALQDAVKEVASSNRFVSRDVIFTEFTGAISRSGTGFIGQVQTHQDTWFVSGEYILVGENSTHYKDLGWPE
jgi:hypothetical protein